jgi:hypothetical protein
MIKCYLIPISLSQLKEEVVKMAKTNLEKAMEFMNLMKLKILTYNQQNISLSNKSNFNKKLQVYRIITYIIIIIYTLLLLFTNHLFHL